MPRRPLIAVGVALTALAVALLTWVMQRGGEPAEAAVPVATAARAAPTVTEPSTTSPSPTPTKSRQAPAPPAAARAPGLRLSIPDIGLDHQMSGGGVDDEGKINPDPGTVMWFKGFDRVRPGRVGTAVIAGHVATGERRDVFADLADVDVGDTVKVFEDGKTITYRVTRASAIDKYEVTTDEAVWGANTSRSRLAIITCDDAFGFRSDGHRKANFVVIAERV